MSTNVTLLLGNLEVTVLRARIPESTDWLSRPNPYARVTLIDDLCGDQSEHTQVAALTDTDKSVYTWDAALTFFSATADTRLRLELFDRDHLSADDPLGTTTLPLTDLLENPSEDGLYRHKLDLEHEGTLRAQLIVVLNPANTREDAAALTELIERCEAQEVKLRHLHGELQRQLNLFRTKLAELQGKSGRETLALQYEEDIQRFHDQLGKLEAIFNTVWRKQMFLRIRRPLILLHKSVPTPLRFPLGEMDRDASTRYAHRLDAQLGAFKRLRAEAQSWEQKLRDRLELAAHEVDSWITDATRLEVNLDRGAIAGAYKSFAQRMNTHIERHDLARDHLELQLLRMSRPVLDLSFLEDDLAAVVDATAMETPGELGEVGVAMLLDAVQEGGERGTAAQSQEDSLRNLHLELEANFAAVSEIEALM